MSAALLTFVSFLVAFIVTAALVSVEASKGRRLVLQNGRDWLDERLVRTQQSFASVWKHFSRYIVKLGWYYSIHSLLATILRLLVSVYTYFENHFEHNRTKAKQLRLEKKKVNSQSHFAKVTAHKKATSLSPEEKKKLSDAKLEVDH
jgi:hypothetical protein